jgi:F-type H+-transporting ATPase subunit epsilon
MKLKVRIITPNGVFADDKEVNSAYLQTTDGDMTILPKHSPLVSTLKIGTMTLSNDSEKTLYPDYWGIT